MANSLDIPATNPSLLQQIWFQNRRQNDRRKARPLSPQEVAAIQCGGMHIVSPTTASIMAGQPCPTSMSPLANKTHTSHTSHTLQHPPGSPHRLDTHPGDYLSGESPTNSQSDRENRGLKVSDLTSSPESTSHSPVMSQSLPISGFEGPRWSFGAFSAAASQERGNNDSQKYVSLPSAVRTRLRLTARSRTTESFSSSCSSTRSDGPFLPRPVHKVRLSFSLEGKAEIVSNEASPPRPQPERPMSTVPTLAQFRPRTLQRSQSAASGVTLPPISTLTGNLPPPRLGRGRARDVHAWELCCDDNTPDDLTQLAESESNGSAFAAIKLLRSTSTSSVLQPSGSKRNATVSKQAQRPHNAKKPKLTKAHSISGSSTSENQAVPIKLDSTMDEDDGADSNKKLKVSMLVSPSGDSDKENWSPDEDGNPRPGTRRPVPPTAQGTTRLAGRPVDRVLQEQQPTRNLFGAGARASTAPTLARRSAAKGGKNEIRIYEDGRIFDSEVEKFMRGEVSPSKKGDVDCVAGLLALSQGNWR